MSVEFEEDGVDRALGCLTSQCLGATSKESFSSRLHHSSWFSIFFSDGTSCRAATLFLTTLIIVTEFFLPSAIPERALWSGRERGGLRRCAGGEGIERK